MGQLSFFYFLVFQATFMGVGLFFIPAMAIFMLANGERRPCLFALPVVWLIPLVVSAIFHEPPPGLKSAGWTAYLALPSIIAFLVAAVALWALRRTGDATAIWIGINVPPAFLGAFVTAVAAGGDWL